MEFEKGQGRDGRPQAVKVRLTETHANEEAKKVTQAEAQKKKRENE